jgi:hypothetical protein
MRFRSFAGVGHGCGILMQRAVLPYAVTDKKVAREAQNILT